MFPISSITIILVVITIALMGGFSSSKGKSRRSHKSKDLVINSITSEILSRDEVERYRRNKTPIVIDVKIAGASEAARKKKIRQLNAGDHLYVAWSSNDNSGYTIAFINSLKEVYATAFDKDKHELANRYDYIREAIVESVDKDIPRLRIKVLF